MTKIKLSNSDVTLPLRNPQCDRNEAQEILLKEAGIGKSCYTLNKLAEGGYEVIPANNIDPTQLLKIPLLGTPFGLKFLSSVKANIKDALQALPYAKETRDEIDAISKSVTHSELDIPTAQQFELNNPLSGVVIQDQAFNDDQCSGAFTMAAQSLAKIPGLPSISQLAVSFSAEFQELGSIIKGSKTASDETRMCNHLKEYIYKPLKQFSETPNIVSELAKSDASTNAACEKALNAMSQWKTVIQEDEGLTPENREKVDKGIEALNAYSELLEGRIKQCDETANNQGRFENFGNITEGKRMIAEHISSLQSRVEQCEKDNAVLSENKSQNKKSAALFLEKLKIEDNQLLREKEVLSQEAELIAIIMQLTQLLFRENIKKTKSLEFQTNRIKEARVKIEADLKNAELQIEKETSKREVLKTDTKKVIESVTKYKIKYESILPKAHSIEEDERNTFFDVRKSELLKFFQAYSDKTGLTCHLESKYQQSREYKEQLITKASSKAKVEVGEKAAKLKKKMKELESEVLDICINIQALQKVRDVEKPKYALLIDQMIKADMKSFIQTPVFDDKRNQVVKIKNTKGEEIELEHPERKWQKIHLERQTEILKSEIAKREDMHKLEQKLQDYELNLKALNEVSVFSLTQ